MIAWWLCRRVHADLTGEGARRWNSPGRPLVYLAEHPALAALEVRVHLDLPFELLPVDFVLMQIAVADGPTAGPEPPASTAGTGDTWLTEVPGPTLRVPSVLLPHAWNILFNPRHPQAPSAAIRTIEPFGFGPRLWRPLDTEGSAKPA